MRKIELKKVLWLCLPAFALIWFGFARPNNKPPLKIAKIQVRPAKSVMPGQIKGESDTEVEVILQDNITSWFERRRNEMSKEMPQGQLDNLYGLYIEDRQGRKYGKKLIPADMKTYIPFVWYDGKTRGVGTNGNTVYDNSHYSWKFSIPLKQIPKSAGKLVLKCVIMQYNANKITSLPIAITVRE